LRQGPSSCCAGKDQSANNLPASHALWLDDERTTFIQFSGMKNLSNVMAEEVTR
jgi:hypothetical protein